VADLQQGDPQHIGPYVLHGRLGSGGMGRVYLGQSPGGRLVAVKVIHDHLAENPGFRARFAREVAAARKVGGMFTAQVVNADLDGPVPWIATAYVPGPSLAAAVERHGPLPVSSVAALAAGLAEGLSAVHEAGVIHRDLTPSNVILAQDGPRIIDFGISSAADATALTGTGYTIGSPGFMSPEQAEGKTAGPPSDIFSLGAVLTFAAKGQGPFGAGNSAALLYKVVNGKPDIDGVPGPLRLLLMWCMEKDPENRPTASQVLTEVASVYSPAPGMASWLPAKIFDTSGGDPDRERADEAARGQQTRRDVDEPTRTSVVTPQPRPEPRPDDDQGTPAPEPEPVKWWRRPRNIVGAVVALAAVITLVVVALPGPAPKPKPPAITLLAYNQLQAGDCLAGTAVAGVLGTDNPWPAKVEAVPCGKSHLAEVFFANMNYWPQQEAFPGYQSLVNQGIAQCNDEQTAYTGITYSQSIYKYHDIGPYTATDWQSGSRGLVCVAYYPTTAHPHGAVLTASIKGDHR
jgi:serine/threonine protein kinase